MPRFRKTGLPIFPAAFRSSKFCMFRAPICRQSAYFATMSMDEVSSASVTTGRPVSSRAAARIFSPSSPSPWNE